jgi:acyl-coenzyme A synthetase/AMP-(fatty) acid ligase
MFDDVVRFKAAFRGDSTALISPRQSWTFAQLEADVRRATHELMAIEARPGESVAVAVGRPHLEWVLILALARLGIASAPRNDIQSRYLITDRPGETEQQNFFLSAERIATITEGPERPLTRIEPSDPDAMARVVRSSGTTGGLKRVGYSWRTLQANIFHQLEIHAELPGPWHITTGIKTPFEFHHVLAAWTLGNAAITGVGPDPKLILRMKPRLLGIVPIQLEFLIDSLPADHERWPLRIVTGGSAMPAELVHKVRDRLTDDLLLNYGMTEVSQIATADMALLEREPQAAGYPRPNVQIRVVDDQDRELPAGRTGRFCLRSNRPTTGYLDDPELTAQCYRNGWFYSNDIGFQREDGLLVLEGRTDDLMNLGGHKVLPRLVEEAALACPKVREAAAFAFEVDSGIDRCGVAVVVEDGFEMAKLGEVVRAALTPVHAIRIMVVDSLPRNEMGKIERSRLGAMMRSQVERRGD